MGSDDPDGTAAVDEKRPGAGDDAAVRVGFVCVRNAGRSQMATAFAERERRERGLTDTVAVVTGGTDPADAVHDVAVAAMDEVGIDIAGREPRAVSTAELEACDYVATMGCSTLDLDTSAGVDVRDWGLDDPGGRPLAEVRPIREEIGERVGALFDEVERDLGRRADGSG